MFFSIDPGYRGVKGRVNTQYQNLVEKGDEFKDGFYVPENVYIIGTMNDIDRGVECMDFAIRRRFAWKEISPNDREDILRILGSDESSAINRMNKLNDAIKNIYELSSAFCIGPAYFLKLQNYSGSFEDKIQQLWKYHIQGLLSEYLRGVREMDKVLGNLQAVFFNTTADETD